MTADEIRSCVLNAFMEKPIFEGIEPDQDFFMLGVSSLTVVDLQLQLEKLIGCSVDTSQLMANPTINGWVDLFSESKLTESQTA